MTAILNYILLFLIYSMFGWIIEIINTLIREKKFVNRGFLMGPFIPIYGVGAILATLLLSKYRDDLASLFFISIAVFAVLEYIVSYFMEKIFKLRWWDYTYKKFNINGRVALDNLIAFGILGVIATKYLSPLLLNFISNMKFDLKLILFLILSVSFLVDYILSFIITFNLKTITKNLKKDSTEDIKKTIKKHVVTNSKLYNRILNAFPKIYKVKEPKKK